MPAVGPTPIHNPLPPLPPPRSSGRDSDDGEEGAVSQCWFTCALVMLIVAVIMFFGTMAFLVIIKIWFPDFFTPEDPETIKNQVM